ncbi:hypothetical protein GPECTOR_76g787 [Gonium pectorale]|uniref:Uncharacterized protein n=1 Tax=Gonium pectorale TaxID=33097 RepID=A0A150G267_GONPE|nr:hypothetical protein GPECTOR_76g787 [Gonium pectorale]|eukprot:KXZ43966.1 hypothetical protein GPECTOR_76g787 [Gonium pectorale]
MAYDVEILLTDWDKLLSPRPPPPPPERQQQQEAGAAAAEAEMGPDPAHSAHSRGVMGCTMGPSCRHGGSELRNGVHHTGSATGDAAGAEGVGSTAASEIADSANSVMASIGMFDCLYMPASEWSICQREASRSADHELAPPAGDTAGRDTAGTMQLAVPRNMLRDECLRVLAERGMLDVGVRSQAEVERLRTMLREVEAMRTDIVAMARERDMDVWDLLYDMAYTADNLCTKLRDNHLRTHKHWVRANRLQQLHVLGLLARPVLLHNDVHDAADILRPGFAQEHFSTWGRLVRLLKLLEPQGQPPQDPAMQRHLDQLHARLGEDPEAYQTSLGAAVDLFHYLSNVPCPLLVTPSAGWLTGEVPASVERAQAAARLPPKDPLRQQEALATLLHSLERYDVVPNVVSILGECAGARLELERREAAVIRGDPTGQGKGLAGLRSYLEDRLRGVAAVLLTESALRQLEINRALESEWEEEEDEEGEVLLGGTSDAGLEGGEQDMELDSEGEEGGVVRAAEEEEEEEEEDGSISALQEPASYPSAAPPPGRGVSPQVLQERNGNEQRQHPKPPPSPLTPQQLAAKPRTDPGSHGRSGDVCKQGVAATAHQGGAPAGGAAAIAHAEAALINPNTSNQDAVAALYQLVSCCCWLRGDAATAVTALPPRAPSSLVLVGAEQVLIALLFMYGLEPRTPEEGTWRFTFQPIPTGPLASGALNGPQKALPASRSEAGVVFSDVQLGLLPLKDEPRYAHMYDWPLVDSAGAGLVIRADSKLKDVWRPVEQAMVKKRLGAMYLDAEGPIGALKAVQLASMAHNELRDKHGTSVYVCATHYWWPESAEPDSGQRAARGRNGGGGSSSDDGRGEGGSGDGGGSKGGARKSWDAANTAICDLRGWVSFLREGADESAAAGQQPDRNGRQWEAAAFWFGRVQEELFGPDGSGGVGSKVRLELRLTECERGRPDAPRLPLQGSMTAKQRLKKAMMCK